MASTAPNYDQARKNMVDCQIHTSGVVHPGLLIAFETVPRENFVPEHLKAIAYYDEDIKVSKSRALLEPLILSKLLQAADLKETDIVLDIGGGTGYGAAILSPNVSTVIALESDEELLKLAEKSWLDIDACNIVPVNGKLTKGADKHGPFDLIVMHGAVPEIPEDIVAQLNQNGRLLCIVKKPGEKIGQATLVQTLGENQFSSYSLFECGVDYIEGFTPKPAFTF
ncbi:MAG: protein-L-isoaspartate O-methyltransferase [Bdellovibrionales bacterium]